jgi:hypothetical protein
VRTLGTCLIVAAVAACPLRGQQPRQPQVLRIGAPIRVTTADYPGAPLVGVFAGIVGDTLLVGLPGGSDALRLSRGGVTRIETRVGRRSGAGSGALIGMLAGTLAGGIAAAATSPHGLEPSAAGLVLGGGAIGAIAGGVLGGLVFKAPRWVVIPTNMLTESAEP